MPMGEKPPREVCFQRPFRWLGDSLLHMADTAQVYGNEEEAGKALRESSLARKDIYITTKFSDRDGFNI